MPSIIKAYLQSPRLWVAIGAAAVAWFQGNKMGLTDEMILYIVEMVAVAFGVSVSIRAPREWEVKKVDPSA
jgi:hypothetical protein